MRYLGLALLLVTVNSFASTIVVSDIDDTIRHANVRQIEKLTVLKQREFSGLSKLYRQLEKTIRRFEYVSGVPQQIRKVSQFFIFWNLFPQGRLFARDTQYDTPTHKLNAIDQIVREDLPTTMLMFGDNGEKDPMIYQAAAAKYPNTAVIFIHQLYDVEIPQGQTPWLTSIDLTLDLYSRGYITNEGVDEVLTYANKKMLGEREDREEFFPAWAQCKLFFKNYARPSVLLRDSQNQIVDRYEQFLRERCS